MARLAIIGTGYVGLTTGACFAHLGHDVICADVDAGKVGQLASGEIPIVEKRLDELVKGGLADGRLRFVVGASEAVIDCEMAFLCVPTPQDEDGSADLSYIETASREIGPLLPPDAIVVNKSTVPVGSTQAVERVLGRPDVTVVSNPEFLREGSAVEDFLHPDRIVIGCEEQSAAARVLALYIGITAPTLVTDPASAETIKYAANAFLATKLSFVNAIAAVCEGVGADVNDVMLGLGYDSRIGDKFLQPGPGWGGSCFPKDTRALVRIAADSGYEFELLDGVIAVNEEQFARVVEKVRTAVGGELRSCRVGVWGMTFKAGTDDLRESPSLAVIRRLLVEGASVCAYDPTVSMVEQLPNDLSAIEVVTGPVEACLDVDVLLVLTEWDEFLRQDPLVLAQTMRRPAVVDARNLLDRSLWLRHGFHHQGIGR